MEESAVSLKNKGNLAMSQGDLELAKRFYLEATQADPNYMPAYYNLGNVLRNQGKLAEALQAYEKAAAITPGDYEIHVNVGATYQQMRRFALAIDAFTRATALAPQAPEPAFNLKISQGFWLQEQEQYDEAEKVFRSLLQIRPDLVEIHAALGDLFHRQKRYRDAEASYRQCLAINPKAANIHNDFGILLAEQQRYGEAEKAYRQALEVQPDFLVAMYNLGSLLLDLKRYEEAEAAYRQVLAYQPEDSNALIMASFAARFQCNWQHPFDGVAAVRKALADEVPIPPFVLFSSHAGDDGALQRHIAALYCRKKLGTILDSPPLTDPRRHRQRERLRVGYLSADFHDHATSHLLTGVLEHHDRTRFAIYGYSYGPEVEDAYRRRIVNSCDQFRNLFSLSDRESARLIAEDEIDILVDLKGFTTDSRLGITARRPAPLIVNWLGYPGTLGDRRLADYLIGDPIISPPAMAANFSETLALLPHCYQPNDQARVIGKAPTRREAGLPDDGVVFCCFNQNYKLGPTTFDAWAEILTSVPGSILWLLEPPAVAIANLRREAAQRRVDPSRIIFAPRLPIAEHLGRLALADLALDTFPCTSHTTASDALWSGVPLITKIGNTLVSRVAASLLHAAGLSELVAETWADYARLATTLAVNTSRLQAIRLRLRENRRSSPLFDTQRFARDLEGVFARIWLDHGHGKMELIA